MLHRDYSMTVIMAIAGAFRLRCLLIGGGVMRAIALVATLFALAYLFYAAVSLLGQALVFA